MKNLIAWALAAVSCLAAMAATAADVSLSGFGTLGYSKSNRPYKYERFIDDHGTFARDSVAGVQADVKFTDSTGATIQGKFARSVKNDASWDPTLTWAFVSWRPSNDLLIRVGKQRVALFLNSENMDVGVTHDFTHLPTEMYSLMRVKPGTPARNRFLQDYLNQDEEKYTAYWTVRRYIGKGAPPAELPSSADVVNHVLSTPGAIGYIDEAELKPGMNVIARK